MVINIKFTTMKNESKYSTWQKIEIIVILTVSIIFLIFSAQNWDKVDLSFMAWVFQVNLFIALFVSFILGVLITMIFYRIRIKSLNDIVNKKMIEVLKLKKNCERK